MIAHDAIKRIDRRCDARGQYLGTWGAGRTPAERLADRTRGSSPCHCHWKKRQIGFTLVEVMFSILFLGMMVVGITGVYLSAQQSLHAQDRLLPLDSRLRGRMEEILSRPFGAIAGGSEAVTIEGENYTFSWTVIQPDLDGDSVAETTAKQVTVTVDGRSLTTLVIDSQGKVGKI